MNSAERTELERLLSSLFDDGLNADEARRLNELLGGDVACRQLYLRYVDLHSRLMHHPRLPRLAELESTPAVVEHRRAPTASAAPSGLLAEHAAERFVSRPSPTWPAYVFTALATLAASLVIQIAWMRTTAERRGANPGTAAAPTAALPAVVRVADVPTTTPLAVPAPTGNATAKGPVVAAVPNTVDPKLAAPTAVAVPVVGPVAAPAAPVVPATLVAGTVVRKEAVEYVATVLRTVDCDWGEGRILERGMRLLPGLVRLRSGSATIRVDGGSELILSGPAMLELASCTSATLLAGRVLFRSDDAAERFDLRTPHSRMVDYGTEYAVVVNARGEELHVFDGEVVRTAKEAAAGVAELSVSAGEARQFASAADRLGQTVPLDSKRLQTIPRSPTDVGGDATATLWAYEPFDYVDTRLPSRVSGTGGSGWSGGWSAVGKSDDLSDFRLAPGMKRGNVATGTKGGSLNTFRRAAMSRRLEKPVLTDGEGLFYFSVLVRCNERKPLGGRPCDVQFILFDDDRPAPQHKLSASLSWSTGTLSVCWEGGGVNASLPVEMNKTYLLVGKIVASARRPDQAFLRLYGQKQLVTAEEPAQWTVVSRPVYADVHFDSVQLHASTSFPVGIDEVRLGSTWNAVAAPYVVAADTGVRDEED
jgi:hypothetical protein